MSPRIYTSPFPDVPVDHCSLFTKLFRSRGPNDVGGHPESWTAYVDAASGTGLTRAQVKTLSLSFAYGLRDHPTTRPLTKRGDTVLLFSPNSLAWPIVLYGSVAAGLRCTLANTAYTSHELGFQYKDSAAKLVLTYEENIGVVMKMFEEQGYSNAEARQRIVVLRRDLRWAGGPAVSALPEAAGLVSLEELLARGVLDREETFEGEAAHETVYLCYSSGTTGNPKGVETTHQNMTTLVDIIVKFPLPPGDAPMLGILPFYHIYGVANLLHHPFYIGVPVVIQTRFDPEQFCANIQKYKVAFACIVPPVLVALARHPAVDSYDLSSLQYMCSGAAPLGADLVKMVQARLLSKRKHGSTCLITQGYGLTETSPSTHMLAFDVCDERVGSIGQLFPTLKARIVADDDGLVDAEEGERGELWFQGPTIMKGYLGNPTATKHSLTSDRWFKTGDIAIRDKEGYYYIVDRKKELIKYKGFQVAPAELEAILLTHPDVADAAVIGVDDAKEATELPRAYVVHAHASKIKAAEAKAAFEQSIVRWMETKVAKHKFLRGGVCVINEVPKSAAGKILRRQLRDQAKAELERGEIKLLKAKL